MRLISTLQVPVIRDDHRQWRRSGRIDDCQLAGNAVGRRRGGLDQRPTWFVRCTHPPSPLRSSEESMGSMVAAAASPARTRGRAMRASHSFHTGPTASASTWEADAGYPGCDDLPEGRCSNGGLAWIERTLSRNRLSKEDYEYKVEPRRP